MGLPTALRAHQQENYDLAAKHYQRALQQGDHQPILFQNYGSLLRNHGKDDLATKVYEQGLRLYPKDQSIRQNFANLLSKTSPWRALELHLSNLRDNWNSNLRSSHFLAVVSLLESQGCNLWAYQICKLSFQYIDPKPSLLVVFYRLATCQDNNILSSQQRNNLSKMIEHHLEDSSLLSQAEYFFTLSWVHVKRRECEKALLLIDKARNILLKSYLKCVDDRQQAQNLNSQYSWNMACMLLSFQNFEEGWQYFDYGLRAKANGSQKWQRALPKPFTFDQLTLWRGQPLIGQKILLLEEQAIGDVMQFLTLLPGLLAEAQHVGLLLNNRLIPLYNRSFSSYIKSNRLTIYSFDDVLHDHLRSSGYNFQSPIGSICQYRFTDIHQYGCYSPVLSPSKSLVQNFREKYLSFPGNAELLVGISWRGGGTGDRIKEKSLDIKMFAQMLNIPGVRFISLQYGESEPVVESWRKSGLDVHYDSTVNSLKDMDTWLAQVASCDGVISVANTTIHGSGGLDIPTLCLLSLHSDWRWLRDQSVSRSYWYPSVGIARETEDRGWLDAIANVRSWILSGLPYPTGSVSI
jgi:tetratricopeptide (TPR) repeat protein